MIRKIGIFVCVFVLAQGLANGAASSGPETSKAQQLPLEQLQVAEQIATDIGNAVQVLPQVKIEWYWTAGLKEVQQLLLPSNATRAQEQAKATLVQYKRPPYAILVTVEPGSDLLEQAKQVDRKTLLQRLHAKRRR